MVGIKSMATAKYITLTCLMMLSSLWSERSLSAEIDVNQQLQLCCFSGANYESESGIALYKQSVDIYILNLAGIEDSRITNPLDSIISQTRDKSGIDINLHATFDQKNLGESPLMIVLLPEKRSDLTDTNRQSIDNLSHIIIGNEMMTQKHIDIYRLIDDIYRLRETKNYNVNLLLFADDNTRRLGSITIAMKPPTNEQLGLSVQSGVFRALGYNIESKRLPTGIFADPPALSDTDFTALRRLYSVTPRTFVNIIEETLP